MDDNKDTQDNKKDDYEKYCYLCRRPESQVGKLIYLPNNINICQDCMQKTFDTMNSSGLNMGGLNMNDLMNMGKMPNISMINLADLQGGIPQSQKARPSLHPYRSGSVCR